MPTTKRAVQTARRRRHITNSKRPITKVEDIAGLKALVNPLESPDTTSVEPDTDAGPHAKGANTKAGIIVGSVTDRFGQKVLSTAKANSSSEPRTTKPPPRGAPRRRGRPGAR